MVYASVHRKIVEDVPRGVHVNFLKAERSLHRWALEDLQRIHAAEELAVEEGGGVEMHVLEYLDPIPRRVLAAKGYDKCADKASKLKRTWLLLKSSIIPISFEKN